VQNFPAKIPQFKNERSDSLDFNKETIRVILRNQHYDILYTEKDYYKYDNDFKEPFTGKKI